jgi:hypothetical protein
MKKTKGRKYREVVPLICTWNNGFAGQKMGRKLIKIDIPVTLIGGDAALHVIVVVGLPVAPVEVVRRAPVNPLISGPYRNLFIIDC